MENKIILYTTHCPRCEILTKKLNDKNIKYTVCEDTSVMEEKGFTFLPVLEVGEKIMGFGEAIKWVNSLEE